MPPNPHGGGGQFRLNDIHIVRRPNQRIIIAGTMIIEGNNINIVEDPVSPQQGDTIMDGNTITIHGNPVWPQQGYSDQQTRNFYPAAFHFAGGNRSSRRQRRAATSAVVSPLAAPLPARVAAVPASAHTSIIKRERSRSPTAAPRITREQRNYPINSQVSTKEEIQVKPEQRIPVKTEERVQVKTEESIPGANAAGGPPRTVKTEPDVRVDVGEPRNMLYNDGSAPVWDARVGNVYIKKEEE